MRLARALNILEADRRLTLTLGVLHFIVAAAHSLFDIGVTSLLVARLGPDTLPQVYLGSALALIVLGLVVIPVIDRLPRTRLFASVLALFALVLLVSPAFAERSPGLVYRGLYIACFVMKSLVFLQFWLLAGELLDIRQARRLFPVLLSASLMGGLVASVLATLRPEAVATTSLLYIAGGLLLVGLAPVAAVARRYGGRLEPKSGPEPGAIWRDLRNDFSIALESRLLRTLSMTVLFLALLSQVLDFVMAKAAAVRYALPDGGVDVEALTSFYALLNAAIIGAGALLQLGFANRILSSVGVIRGLLLAPLTFAGAFVVTGAVWFAGGGAMTRSFFHAVVASRAVQKVLRISLVRTSTDLVYNAIPSDRRGRAKAFKETLIEPAGVLASGVVLLLGAQVPMLYLLGGALLLSGLFLVVSLELKDDYVESLVRVLKEKSRFRYAFPSVVMRAVSPETRKPQVTGLRRALDHDAASVRLLAVEVAAELKEPEAAALLVERFREEEDAEVRAGMLAALGKMVHRGTELPGAESLADVDPRVRASGMASMAESGIFRIEDLTPAESEPAPPGVSERDASPEPPPEAEDSTERVTVVATGERRARFLELARSGEPEALNRLVHYLDEGDGATRHLAARALEAVGEPAVDVLTLALWSSDVEARRYVIRTLDRIGSERARQALLPALSLEAEEAYYDLLRLEALKELEGDPALELLRDSLEHRVGRAKRNAHRILRSVFIAERGMRLILSNLNHPDRFVRSSAIEALEVRVDAALLGGVLPLFEHESARAIAEHGSSLFDFPVRDGSEVLEELTRHRSAWLRATAVYVIGRRGDRRQLKPVEERLSDASELARLNAIEALGRIGDQTTRALLDGVRLRESGRVKAYAERALETLAARV